MMKTSIGKTVENRKKKSNINREEIGVLGSLKVYCSTVKILSLVRENVDRYEVGIFTRCVRFRIEVFFL